MLWTMASVLWVYSWILGFDTADYCILLDKLYFYGIRGQALGWFSSYLHDRQQLVNYCGCESDLKRIKCGVPNGSILGHLLFLLYINDLPQASEYFMSIIFAGDTNLFAIGYNLNYIISQINNRKNVQKLCFDSNILTLKRLYSYNIRMFMYEFSKNMPPELFEYVFQ